MSENKTPMPAHARTYEQAINDYKPLCGNAVRELHELRDRLDMADAKDDDTLLRTILRMEHKPTFHLDATWRADGREDTTELTIRLPLKTAGGAYDALWHITRKGAYAYGMLSAAVADLPVPYDGVARSAQWHVKDGNLGLDLTPDHVDDLFEWAGRWLTCPTQSRVQGTVAREFVFSCSPHDILAGVSSKPRKQGLGSRFRPGKPGFRTSPGKAGSYASSTRV